MSSTESLPFGFEWVEARPAHFEVQKVIPRSTRHPGATVTFSGSDEARVRQKVASWAADQLRRKGGGLLGLVEVQPKPETSESDDGGLVAA